MVKYVWLPPTVKQNLIARAWAPSALRAGMDVRRALSGARSFWALLVLLTPREASRRRDSAA